MKVKFWGVRGSVAISQSDSRFYGGNTTCVEVTTRSGCRVLIDAGTGIRDAGNAMLGNMPIEAHLLFTHYHWDHIMGFPFFVPAFIPGNTFHIYGQPKGELKVQEVLSNLMSPPNFPVPIGVMGAKFEYYDLKEDGVLWLSDDLKVTYGPLFHPNGVVGFRFESEGRTFTFLTDVEHESEDEVGESALMLSKDSNLVAFDCQYTPEEYPSRQNWGHSTWEVGLKLVRQARADALYMIHHDPGHNDEQIQSMLVEARVQAKPMGLRVEAVHEGMEVDV